MASNTGIFYTERLPTAIRVAQVVGLTSSAFLTGKIFAQSYGTIPSFLLAPAPLLAQQWKKMFDGDKLLAPILSLISASVFGYFAYRDPNPRSPSQVLYATASGLLLTLFPYSMFVLHPINNKLEDKARNFGTTSVTDTAAESGARKDETTHYLVDQWGTVNLGRAVVSAIASVAALWAALDHAEVVPAVVGLGSGANRLY